MAFKGQAANNQEHDPGTEAGSSNDTGGTLTEHGKLKCRKSHETQEENCVTSSESEPSPIGPPYTSHTSPAPMVRAAVHSGDVRQQLERRAAETHRTGPRPGPRGESSSPVSEYRLGTGNCGPQ